MTALKVEVVVQVVKTCESPWSPLLPEKKKMIRVAMAIRVVKLSRGETKLERLFAKNQYIQMKVLNYNS